MYDFAIVGGGIVGLATGYALARRHPGARLLVVEKEPGWAAHQTGHNSGVLHSGVYYKPGSLKARLAREGGRRMVAFCREHDIAHEICGKVIVAADGAEMARLDALAERGRANGVAALRTDATGLRKIEPHARGGAALVVPEAGIVDYRAVAERLADLLAGHGADLRTGTRVTGLDTHADAVTLRTTGGEFPARFLVNCAGLHSDRVARLGGVDPRLRIVPFRGEYYDLIPERRGLVRALIYPVPNPAFPFLGVHLTRMIDGTVHAGPNAVLALKREGYRKTDADLRDLLETLTYPAFYRLALRHFGEGAKEVWRSLSKAAFVRSLQRLVPEVRAQDVMPAHAGVRAQALADDGTLVDDFALVSGPRAVHVCNAPSPAATASLAIGDAIADEIARHGDAPDHRSQATHDDTAAIETL
ncbi:MAG TPA: L-2-hydroxyglutarate oxidase [Armatimonadaceae bacterium]|nr:L-2-hydroxyglutarate oxidase [Armatimonadaceae bacterium]